MIDPVKILGALLGNGSMSSGSGANILKSVLNATISGDQSNQLGSILGSVLGGGRGQSSPSGGDAFPDHSRNSGDSRGGGLGGILGDVLGGLDGGGGSAGGGLADLLGGVLGGGGGNSELADLVSAALNQYGEQSQQNLAGNVTPRRFEDHSPKLSYDDASRQATMMINAMLNAAKADGRFDNEERDKIAGRLGDLSDEEITYINNELSRPLDVDGFVRSVPPHSANQVYAMSLMAIDLDTNPEAQYLHQLAQGLGIAPDTVNQIHRQLGAPQLYT